jgi:hypothetical protein
MSERRDDAGWIYRVLDYYPGVENIRQYRDDVREIIIENSDRFQRWNPDIQQIKREAHKSATKARDTNSDKITFAIGVLLTVFAIIPPVEILLSVFSTLVSLFAFIRRATVEVLLYELPYQHEAPENVKFAYAWNSAMSGWTPLLLIPMGLFVKIYSNEYRIVLWFINDVVGEEF